MKTVEHAFDSILAKTADVLGITPDEVRRRARLAAAAQELYDALCAICEAGRLLSREDAARIFDDDSTLLRAARDAIAKAEGR